MGDSHQTPNIYKSRSDSSLQMQTRHYNQITQYPIADIKQEVDKVKIVEKSTRHGTTGCVDDDINQAQLEDTVDDSVVKIHIDWTIGGDEDLVVEGLDDTVDDSRPVGEMLRIIM